MDFSDARWLDLLEDVYVHWLSPQSETGNHIVVFHSESQCALIQILPQVMKVGGSQPLLIGASYKQKNKQTKNQTNKKNKKQKTYPFDFVLCR